MTAALHAARDAALAALLEVVGQLDPVAVRLAEVRAALVTAGVLTRGVHHVLDDLRAAGLAGHTLESVRRDLDAWAAGGTVIRHPTRSGGVVYEMAQGEAIRIALLGSKVDAAERAGGEG